MFKQDLEKVNWEALNILKKMNLYTQINLQKVKEKV